MAPLEETKPIMTPEEIQELSKKMGGGDQVKRAADDFPNPISVPYAKLEALFPNDEKNNVWTVRGSFAIIPYFLSLTSTMTIHKNENSGKLTLFNAFRCREDLETEILKLGPVGHVVKLGQFHGDADAYYCRAPQFQSPKLWTLPAGSVAKGTKADGILSSNASALPIEGAKVYTLDGHPFPEGLMTIPYNAGHGMLLVACDSLVHIPNPSIVSYPSRFLFWMMGFNMQSAQDVPKPVPLWMKQTVGALGAPRVRKWYQDVIAMEWTHFIGAHGGPARNCNHDAVMTAVEQGLSHVQ